jgi:putative hydrolase of the HAD superfamily
MLKKFLLSLLLLWTSCSYTKIIIWDLGDVITGLSKIGMAKETLWRMGPLRLTLYLMLDWGNPANLQKKTFDLLYQAQQPPADYVLAVTGKGLRLPYMLCQYQAGKKTAEEFLREGFEYVDSLPQDTFKSDREKILVKEIMRTMVDSDMLARNTYLIPEAVQLFKEVCEATDETGKKKNRCYALSNWEYTSFNKFASKHSDFFSLFEKIIISGQSGLMKPNKGAYRDILHRFDLDPKDCVFIDDQEINTNAAQEEGISAIWFKDRNYDALRQELREREIL